MNLFYFFLPRLARNAFRMTTTLLVLALCAPGGVIVCLWSTLREIDRELRFQRQFGDNWKNEYEQMFGTLSQAHVRIAIGILGAIAIGSTGVWFFCVLRRHVSGVHGQTSRRRRLRESTLERVVRYKTRALVGVYFGVPGILMSVLLTVFRLGIFADHANEVALAIFIFLGAYSAVVTGCYWWLKAKSWPEGVVFIAFMPLAIFFIPFVRLLVLAAPQLLMAAMVMMPLILVVVVAVLPDKSGLNHRRAAWEMRGDQRKTVHLRG